MSKYYNREGKPITLHEWGRLFEDVDYKIVKRTVFCKVKEFAEQAPTFPNTEWVEADVPVEEPLTVSTVWLGMDHNWGSGYPLIFETMVFGVVGDEYQKRYCTLEDAIVGHDEIVLILRLTMKTPK